MLINSNNRVSNDTFLFTKLIIVGIFNDEIHINVPNNSKWLNSEQNVYLNTRYKFQSNTKIILFFKIHITQLNTAIIRPCKEQIQYQHL
jgi:hypothetical protein